jgi:histidyl-tRNA synthetase
MKTETVKGFNDFIGKEALKRLEIRKVLIETFERYGFEPAETPIIEYEEFVKGDNLQDEAVSDILKLQDQGKRKLALRYELTFQLKRLMKNKKLPYKRFQIGEVFRDEPTKKNRFRQFTQCDADIIGATIKDEAEILSLIKDILDKLNIKFTIFVNNRELLNEILDEQKIRNKEQVIKEIDKLDKLPEKQVLLNLRKFKAEKLLNIFKKPEKYFTRYRAYSGIRELKKYCNIYNVKIEFSPSLARGLSYYNKTIFEVKTKEMKETINAGGSYMFNGVQSSGFAFGLERLSMLAKIKLEKEKTMILSLNQEKIAIKLAQKLRKKGEEIIIFYGKPSKALEYANSYDISEVIFVGKEEIKKGKFKVKNMKTGKENFISEKSLL